MKRAWNVLALLLLTAFSTASAQDGANWTVLTPGTAYGVRPVESKPFIVLAAVRGETLSEPINIGFYVLSSPVCKALANPVDGPASGAVGSVGLVEIDGKDYALDGWCDGGNLTMTPSYWVTRQALLNSVRSDALMDVWFKDNPPPGFHLHYRTSGFSKVLKNLGVQLPAVPVATSQALPLPSNGQCATPNAEYPMQAMRMNQQGVVIIGLTVTADRHASNLSIESSSGSTALDNSALAAVSQAVCNAPLGTHISLPVKFSLQH